MSQPIAVVVGLCAHGLAIVRCLAKNNVKVYAIEADENLPGFRTKFADVHLVEDINNKGLVDALLELKNSLNFTGPPVLFLTNDNMVRVVIEHAEKLEGVFLLSWLPSRHLVSRLVDKSGLGSFCQERGLRYPYSDILRTANDFEGLPSQLSYPIIVKPTIPLSKFKVKKVRSDEELVALMDSYTSEFPFILQQYIPGGDDMLQFSAIYLKDGRALCRFEGKKISSIPPGLGQAVAAEPYFDDEVFAISCRFFDGTGFTGIAALEIKRDENGVPWIIEPTVGRTEYCVDLTISNSIELPFIEYCNLAGIKIPECKSSNDRIWFDSERDPYTYFRMVLDQYSLKINGCCPRFSYLDGEDIKPFWAAVKRFIFRVGQSLKNALCKKWGGVCKKSSPP